jgi:hypothetical protein
MALVEDELSQWRNGRFLGPLRHGGSRYAKELRQLGVGLESQARTHLPLAPEVSHGRSCR